MQPRDLAQPIVRAAESRDALPSLRDGLLHRALEDRDEEVVLAAEIQIDGSGGDARGAGDVGDLGVEESVCREGVDGGAQECVALVESVGCGRDGTGSARGRDRHE